MERNNSDQPHVEAPQSPQPTNAQLADDSSSSTKHSKKNAGVQFPVNQIQKKLRKGNYSGKVGGGSAVYMAAVLEYLTGTSNLILKIPQQIGKF